MFKKFLLFLFLKNKNFLLNNKDNNSKRNYILPKMNHNFTKKNNFIKFKIS